jgi:hypothetical protein
MVYDTGNRTDLVEPTSELIEDPAAPHGGIAATMPEDNPASLQQAGNALAVAVH